MSSGILAARRAAELAEERESFEEVLLGFVAAASLGPGLPGRLLRWRGAHRGRRQQHGDGSLFPLPFVEDLFVDTFLSQEGDTVVRTVWVERRRLLLQFVNLWVVFLNIASAGEPGAYISLAKPCKAQSRCLWSLCHRLGRWLSFEVGNEIKAGNSQDVLLLGAGSYDHVANVIPLGARACVPDRAATCDVVQVLRGRGLVGDIVSNPAMVFGQDPSFWVEPPRRVLMVGGGYLDFVARGVRAGLFTLLEESQLPRIGGQAVYSGSFAVKKDEFEDRPIASMEMQNAALIPDSVPSVAFPYLAGLGLVTLAPGTELRIDKRDARA
jgi:hypothetical protein